MTREQAERIRDHAIMKWEAIVKCNPLPEVCKGYRFSCSFCEYFVKDSIWSSRLQCGKCPMDCTKVGSNFQNWVNNGNEENALAVLEQIKAITVEQIMEAQNDKRTSNNHS